MKQNDRSQRNALRPGTFSLECVSKLRWAVADVVRIQVFAEVTRSLTTFATVLKRPLVLAVAVAISLVSVSGVREIRAEDSQEGVSAKTWEEYHPEVAEVFRKGLIRVPNEDFQWRDKTIREGETITMLIGSANRDPDIFDNPNGLDITRHPNKHLGFSHGIHFCLGAPLARLEGNIAFRAIAQRFPQMQLDDGAIRYLPAFGLRSLESLPVQL